jgi:hypothetical protein
MMRRREFITLIGAANKETRLSSRGLSVHAGTHWIGSRGSKSAATPGCRPIPRARVF